MSVGKGRRRGEHISQPVVVRKPKAGMAGRANSKAEQVYGAVKEAILSGDSRARRAHRQDSRSANGSACRAFPYPRRSAGSLSSGWCESSRSTARSSRASRPGDVRERLFIRRALEGEIAAEAALRLSDGGQAPRSPTISRGERGGARPATGRDSTRSTSRSTRSYAQARARSQRRDPRRRARASRTRPPAADAPPGRMQATLRRT